MSATNVYIGTVKDSVSGGSGYLWKSNYDKLAMVFTAGSTYTMSSACFNLQIVETVSGYLQGELTMRVYQGDPTGAQTTLASGTLNVREITSTIRYMWFSLPSVSIVSGTVYTLEISTSVNLNQTNYMYLGYITTGGGANNQLWYYSASGGWYIQGAAFRAGFATSDNSDGGKYVIRTDSPSSTVFGVSGPKGAAVSTTDTYSVCMGATLTRDSDFTCLKGRMGDTVSTIAGAYGTCGDLYKYGIESTNAGRTITWTGNANATLSGWYVTPTTPDSSSKSCRLLFNGTVDSPVKITNLGDAFAAAQSWDIYGGYGTVLATYTSFNYIGQGTLFQVLASSSSKTDHPTYGVKLDHCTIQGFWSGYGIFNLFSAASDLITWLDHCTLTASFVGSAANAAVIYGQIPATALAGCKLVISNVCRNRAAGATGGGFWDSYVFPSGTVYYKTQDTYGIVDIRFSYTTPLNFSVSDTETYGTLDFKVDNISAIQPNDFFVVYNSSDVEIGRCTRAEYEAELYEKPANTLRVPGFVNEAAYSGLYSRFVRDSLQQSLKSSTDDGTPSLDPGYPARIDA